MQFQGLLSQVVRFTGELADKSGDRQTSLDAFEESRDLIADILVRNPLVNEYRAQLANILRRLGSLRTDAHEALEDFQQSKDALLWLTKDSPKVAVYQYDLANVWLEIGLAQKRMQHNGNAIEAFNSAISTARGLLLLAPDNVHYLETFANAYKQLAWVQRTIEDELKEASTNYKEALKINQQLAGRMPNDPQRQQDLANTFMALGMVTEPTRKPSGGGRPLRTSIGARSSRRETRTVEQQISKGINRPGRLVFEQHSKKGRPQPALEACWSTNN